MIISYAVRIGNKELDINDQSMTRRLTKLLIRIILWTDGSGMYN